MQHKAQAPAGKAAQERKAKAPDPFDMVASAVWIEDHSAVLRRLEDLRAEGIRDLDQWLGSAPDRLESLVALVRPRRAYAAARARGVPRPTLALQLPGQLAAFWADAPRHSALHVVPGQDGSAGIAHTTLVLAADGSGLAVVTEEQPPLSEEARHRLAESQRLEALGRLTGAMAHDFNNLLAVMMGYAEILSDTLPPQGKDQRMANAILAAAERGAELTGQLLAFARRQPLQPVPCDPLEALARIEALLRRLLPPSIRLDIAVTGDPGPIEVDVAALETALVQIVLNSRDAMPDGGTIRLSATKAPAMPPGPGAVTVPHVCIAVADDGIGMDADTRARVFEPFFTTKPRRPGTGLGLSMVHGFVRQSGGDVDIASAPGQGTVVSLRLPSVQP